jgi:tetratricopeptide (TPR) repeat protein
MSDAEALSAMEVFAQVSPAVAFVETPRGTGSGVLIEPGYLVSNAHVVWPYNSVRVVFPDGTEFEDVEVIGWDLMADLALLGLPNAQDVDAEPVIFVDGSELTMGSDIYLIGYPGEVERFPQPSISQGILARVRTWASTGMDVFQVDADITGGQSGGVMVTERGEVIGITTFDYTSATYAMVPSAAYAVPRLNALANGSSTGFSDRRPLGLATATEHTGQLEGETDSDVYVLEAEPGEDVEITVEGVGHPRLMVSSINYSWDFEESQEEDENIQSVSFTVEEDAGPYLVRVVQPSTYRNDYTLSSSHPLALYVDADDHTKLAIGDSVSGAIDLPNDSDWFTLELTEGEKVAIEVDSLVIAPMLSLLYERPTLFESYQSFEGGATNVFGENARLVFEAPKDDSYDFAVVSSYAGGDVGGYFVTVTAADEDEEVTEAEESLTLHPTVYGSLQTYESERFDFALRYPSFWTETECPVQATICFQSGVDAGLIIAEEDLDNLPVDLEDTSQEGYADLIEELIISSLQGAEIVAREPVTTTQGLVGEKFVVSAQAGLVTISRFVYVNEDSVAFNATYFAGTRLYEQLEEMIDYSYSHFREWDEDHLEDDPAYHLDEGARLFAEQEYESAIESLTRAIELDAELAEAYSLRGVVYESMGDYESAIADYEQAMELDPGEGNYVGQLALLYWTQGDLEMALDFADQSIELDPENETFYNNRALIRATAGDFEDALADMEELEEFAEDEELDPHLLDTRAYIYMKMEAYDDAKADYDAALAKDFKSPYPLLGAGIAYARLGLVDEALPLLEYGMELYDEAPSEHPNPQLADLLDWSAEILEAR